MRINVERHRRNKQHVALLLCASAFSPVAFGLQRHRSLSAVACLQDLEPCLRLVMLLNCIA